MVITAGQRRHSFTDLSHSAEPQLRTIARTLVMGCSLPQYALNNTNVNTMPPSLVVYFLSFARNVCDEVNLWSLILFSNVQRKCTGRFPQGDLLGSFPWYLTEEFYWEVPRLELVEVPGHDLSEEIEHLLLWLGSTLPYRHWRFYSFLHAGALQINLSFDLLCLGC